MFSRFDDINILSGDSGHLNADLEPSDPSTMFMGFCCYLGGDHPKGICTRAYLARSRLTGPNVTVTATHPGPLCTHTKFFTSNEHETYIPMIIYN